MRLGCALHICWKRSSGFDEAERLYLEIRSGNPPPTHANRMTATRPDRSVPQDGQDRPIESPSWRASSTLRGSPLAEGAARELKEFERDGRYQRIAALPPRKARAEGRQQQQITPLEPPLGKRLVRGAIGIEAAVVLPYFWMLL